MTRTLTGRTVLVTALVAAVSVIITALVALPVMIRAANDDARRALVEKADLAAQLVDATLGADAPTRERVAATVRSLRDEGVEAVVIRNGEPDRPGLPARVVAEVAAGRSVSQRVRWNGEIVLAEGRPVGQTGDGVVLLGPSTVGLRTVLARLWLALVAGLGAGALAGYLLARRLGRPLRAAAAAARQISAGDRRIRLGSGSPDEVAAVSAALNDLAAALAGSEDRQRLFLTSISHELRTPLTTMKGYAEALADGLVDEGEVRRVGQTMLAEGQRLDRLVADLLALARLEADDFPLEVVRINLVELATAAASSWTPRCEAVGVVLHADLPPYPVMVQTDPGRVRQVVDGLLENALRVVPRGGPIVIRVADAEGPGVLEVRDGGPGLTDDDLAVAFDRGAVHARYAGVRTVGTGLGLALAHRLVTRLGGRLEAGHASEGGARMTVVLPREA